MSEILNNIWSTLSSPEHNKTQSSFEEWQSNFFKSPDVQNNVYNYLKENKLTESNPDEWVNNVNEDIKKSQSSTPSTLATSQQQEEKTPEIEAWQSFKNNLSNAFEMAGDVGEFYGIGTGDKTVKEVAEEGDLGAYSGLNIASTLIWEGIFGKEKMKEWKASSPNFFNNFNPSDSETFKKVLENFELEKQEQKQTMTFKQADSFIDYLSVIGGAISNVGGSVVYNMGTGGTGFFFDFAAYFASIASIFCCLSF